MIVLLDLSIFKRLGGLDPRRGGFQVGGGGGGGGSGGEEREGEGEGEGEEGGEGRGRGDIILLS